MCNALTYQNRVIRVRGRAELAHPRWAILLPARPPLLMLEFVGLAWGFAAAALQSVRRHDEEEQPRPCAPMVQLVHLTTNKFAHKVVGGGLSNGWPSGPGVCQPERAPERCSLRVWMHRPCSS